MDRELRAGRYQRGAALAAVLGAIMLSASGCGSGTTQPSTSTTGTMVSGQMTVGGTSRTYRLLDPSPNDQHAKALVLALHGGREDSTAMITRTNFDQLAEAVLGSMPDGTCAMARPLSVLEIHGTADNQLPYAGGVAPGLSDHTPSSVAIVTAWAQRDQCPTPPQSGGASAVQTMTWNGCAAGTQVALDTVTGGDNSWFSPNLPGADSSLDATQTVWKFFAPLARH